MTQDIPEYIIAKAFQSDNQSLKSLAFKPGQISDLSKRNPKATGNFKGLEVLYFSQEDREMECRLPKAQRADFLRSHSQFEIQEEGNHVLYRVQDEKGNEVCFKTIVIESTKKLKEHRAVSNLGPYKWDNLDVYYEKQKQRKPEDKKPSRFDFIKLLMAQVQKRLFKGINKKAMLQSFSIMVVVIVLQIVISRKVRRISLGLFQAGFMGLIALGAGVSAYKSLQAKPSEDN